MATLGQAPFDAVQGHPGASQGTHRAARRPAHAHFTTSVRKLSTMTRQRPNRHDQLAMIQDTVVNMNKRREWLADTYLPQVNNEEDYVFGADGEELTDEQAFGITAINALEEEWILDPDMREKLSIITFTDD